MTAFREPPVPGAMTGERCETCLCLLPPVQVHGKPAVCVLCGPKPKGSE